MVSTKSVALFALVAMAGATSAFADKAGHGEAVAGESAKQLKSPKMKLNKHSAKADEAGEALKFKPAKLSKKAGKGDGEALAAGEAIKVKGIKIHAKKGGKGGDAEAGEAAAVKHTPKKTAKFAEKVAKLDAKKVKGGVSIVF